MHKFTRAVVQELRFLLATPPVLLIVLFAPLAYPFMYNYLYVNKFETKVPAAVIDLDRSGSSRKLIRELQATEQITICCVSTDPQGARPLIEQGRAQAVFTIPENYERNLLRHQRPVIQTQINATRFMIAVDAGTGLSNALTATGRTELIAALVATGQTRDRAKRLAEPIVPRSEGLGNTLDCYGDYIIPALLLLILTQGLFVGTATSAAGMGRRGRRIDPELGIVRGLLGRALPYLILFSAYSLLFFTIQFRIWHIPFQGKAVILTVLTALQLLSMTAAGFLLGSFCRSRLSAFLLSMFSAYPLFLLSGIAWPRESMPPVLQLVGEFLPTTHFYPAALRAARLGADWQALAQPLVALAAIVLVLSAALLLRTRHISRNEASKCIKAERR